MSLLSSVELSCPYCGEWIVIFVDDSAGDQQYIEDCQVCCRPIQLRVSLDPDGDLKVSASAENEA